MGYDFSHFPYITLSTNNHGSVENGDIWKVITIGVTHVWLPWLSQALNVWYIFTYIWLMFMVNVGKYIIHCAFGYGRKCISPVSHGIFSTQHKLFFRNCQAPKLQEVMSMTNFCPRWDEMGIGQVVVYMRYKKESGDTCFFGVVTVDICI